MTSFGEGVTFFLAMDCLGRSLRAGLSTTRPAARTSGLLARPPLTRRPPARRSHPFRRSLLTSLSGAAQPPPLIRQPALLQSQVQPDQVPGGSIAPPSVRDGFPPPAARPLPDPGLPVFSILPLAPTRKYGEPTPRKGTVARLPSAPIFLLVHSQINSALPLPGLPAPPCPVPDKGRIPQLEMPSRLRRNSRRQRNPYAPSQRGSFLISKWPKKQHRHVKQAALQRSQN